ncbi:hypothetical protein MC7420_4657 [Coleofasciculus chthonoplastes PCC 7420]|uniref:Uncharacterized protein n=1 Tax=Coleofasciculus chthonoplastes PCC 7420 TaxID=118168 RepID=B4VN86_9CYAN|nr:hypothetical protein [Coleofasciculus chthonoplastes]EDX76401.1 hypothetical protein MC7420_4657 [Coleofasciculus chthonoplastes PCC 7420]
MLLLYTPLVRQVLTPLEWETKPNQRNSTPSMTEKERLESNDNSQNQMTDQIRYSQTLYSLERRFLL